jgi:hypothetical protein
MFRGESLMLVLTEGRQRGISPVVKGGKLVCVLLMQIFWDAVAGLLRWGTLPIQQLIGMIIDAIIMDKQAGIYVLMHKT